MEGFIFKQKPYVDSGIRIAVWRTGNRGSSWKISLVAGLQPCRVSPSKTCVLLAFVPRHSRALPASSFDCLLIAYLPKPLPPPVFLHWQLLGTVVVFYVHFVSHFHFRFLFPAFPACCLMRLARIPHVYCACLQPGEAWRQLSQLLCSLALEQDRWAMFVNKISMSPKSSCCNLLYSFPSHSCFPSPSCLPQLLVPAWLLTDSRMVHILDWHQNLLSYDTWVAQ